MRIWKIILALAAVDCLLFCLDFGLAYVWEGHGTVQVVDVSGKPIAGASVEPVSAGFNGPPILTNAKGEATVPLHVIVQETWWVRVSKFGYAKESVDVQGKKHIVLQEDGSPAEEVYEPVKWPLRVTLRPW
jgi:hypothetical protein